jgi:hypothetical protein
LGGTEAVVAVMAAAAPILVALPNLLRSIGLESAADAVENVAGDIPQPPPGDNSLLPGANPPATLFGLPMPLALLLGIGAIFLLTNKKR